MYLADDSVAQLEGAHYCNHGVVGSSFVTNKIIYNWQEG